MNRKMPIPYRRNVRCFFLPADLGIIKPKYL